MVDPIGLITDQKTLAAVNEKFHSLILADNRINFLFDAVDMDALHRKQVWFFASLALESNEGTHDYMQRIHQKLVNEHGLKGQHFDAFVECLAKALHSSELNSDVAEKIISQAEKLRTFVLGDNI